MKCKIELYGSFARHVMYTTGHTDTRRSCVILSRRYVKINVSKIMYFAYYKVIIKAFYSVHKLDPCLPKIVASYFVVAGVQPYIWYEQEGARGSKREQEGSRGRKRVYFHLNLVHSNKRPYLLKTPPSSDTVADRL